MINWQLLLLKSADIKRKNPMATVAELKMQVKSLMIEGLDANKIAKMKAPELEALIEKHGKKVDESSTEENVVNTIMPTTEFFTTKDGTKLPVVKAKIIGEAQSRNSFLFDMNGKTVSSNHPALFKLWKDKNIQAGDEFVFKAELKHDAKYAYPTATILPSANEIMLLQIDVDRENNVNFSRHLNEINNMKVTNEVKTIATAEAVKTFMPVPERRKLVLSRQN